MSQLPLKSNIDVQPEPYWVLHLHDGLTICLPPDIHDDVVYILLEQEDWHDPALALLNQLIKPGLRVTDISAEYGLCGLRLARRLDSTSEVRIQLGNDAQRVWVQASVDQNHIACRLDLQSGSLTTVDRIPAGDLLILSTRALALADFAAQAATLAAGTSLLVLHRLNEQPNPLAWMAALEQADVQCYRHVPGLNLLTATTSADRPLIEPETLFVCSDQQAQQLRACGLIAVWPVEYQPQPVIEHSWEQALSTLPFVSGLIGARRLIDVWRQTDRSTDTHWSSYEQALNAYLSAMVSQSHPDKRLAWLMASRTRLETLLQTGDAHLSTIFLRIRVLADCGERKAALKLAQHLLRRFEKGAELELHRPFLPPHAHYDNIAPKESIATWLVASLLETAERLRGSSTWFPANAPPRSFDHHRCSGFFYMKYSNLY